MKKTLLSAAIAASLVSSAVAAQPSFAEWKPFNHQDQFYVGLNFGRYMTDNVRHLSSPGAAGIDFGYHFNSILAAQVSTLFWTSKGNGASYNSYFTSLDGVVNIDTGTPITPFFSFGAGILKVTQASFAPDFGLGVRYNLANEFGVQLNYRHIMQFNYGNGNDNYVGLGLVWHFGGAYQLNQNDEQQVTQAKPAAQTKPVKKLENSQEQAFNQAKKELKDYLPNGVYQCGTNGASAENGCVTINGNQISMHLNVRFMKSKANIQEQFTPAIDKLGNFMSHYPSTEATLFGYASSEGVLAFNQKLSQQRAEQVKTYLVDHSHIAATRLKAVGMGVKDPIASNKTEVGRRMNRRVEAVVTVDVNK